MLIPNQLNVLKLGGIVEVEEVLYLRIQPKLGSGEVAVGVESSARGLHQADFRRYARPLSTNSAFPA